MGEPAAVRLGQAAFVRGVVGEHARRPNGRFSGSRWSSTRQPAAVSWGHGTDNLLLNELSPAVLTAAGR